LVIDAWEHAFYLQYLNDKAAWVDAFWEVADWRSAGTRFEGLCAA
jgi:Fe-Mn family superoxide dismutase